MQCRKKYYTRYLWEDLIKEAKGKKSYLFGKFVLWRISRAGSPVTSCITMNRWDHFLFLEKDVPELSKGK